MFERLECGSREEWLLQRNNGIGGSDAAIILGVSTFKSPFALYCEKRGEIEHDASDSALMLWGRKLEGPVREHYAESTGRRVEVEPEHSILRSVEAPFMQASLDGRVYDDEIGEGVYEGKTAGFWKRSDWESEPPLQYQIQGQHYLAVTGKEYVSFAVLMGGNDFRWCDMKRNNRFIERLIASEADFWRRVQEGDPPPVDGHPSTSDALAKLYATDDCEVVELPEEAIQWDEARKEAAEAIRAATALKSEAENRIRKAIGNATYGLLPNGKGRFSWKLQHRKGGIVEPSSSRVLRRLKK